MRFKKIYLEITNGCNLNCNFCIKNKRAITNITYDNYKYIIDKIKKYTKSIYLHVLGEPLMHKDILKFIKYASDNKLEVNITTNGYLIDRIKDNKIIKRLNISLHSYNDKYQIALDKYLENIFDVIDTIKDKTFITLRLWVSSKYTEEIISYINNRYKLNINNIENNTKLKILPNVQIDTFHEFIWPDLNNNYYSKTGTCKGLIDHIGILSDGKIIPCCLDTKGIIDLGNIYQDEIKDIINSERVKNMIDGFKKNQKCEELCRHCKFL